MSVIRTKAVSNFMHELKKQTNQSFEKECREEEEETKKEDPECVRTLIQMVQANT